MLESAFAKATKFCREVKMKNGVKIINSGPVDGDRQDDLIIGGIIHGGAKFTVLLWYLPSTGLMEWIESGMNINLGLQI